MAIKPEEHCLLIAINGVVCGIPAANKAPLCSKSPDLLFKTLPMAASWIIFGSTPVFFKNSLVNAYKRKSDPAFLNPPLPPLVWAVLYAATTTTSSGDFGKFYSWPT